MDDTAQLDALIKKNTMLNAKKLSYIADRVDYIIKNKVQGDIVECGVWMGGCTAFIAKLLLKNNDIRTVRLFDSFDDPHEPLPVDGALLINKLGGIKRAQGRIQPIKGYYKKVTKGVGPGNPKKVYDLLTAHVQYPKDKVKIYKGWFQNTLPKYAQRVEKISFLILDCNLYVPTKLCLEFFYDRLSNGGVLFVDDYSTLDGCTKAVNDFLAANSTVINNDIKNIPGCLCIVKKGK